MRWLTNPVAQFLATGFVTLVVVVVVTGALSRQAADEEAVADARARLHRWDSASAEEAPGLGLCAVTLHTDLPIGTAVLKRLPDADRVPTEAVEVGWHLHPDHWGQGYATEAATALVEHGFTTLGLDAIHAVAWAGNAPSFAVMERLGMTRRGTTDRWYGVTLDWWSLPRP